jgi:hypothetical protein
MKTFKIKRVVRRYYISDIMEIKIIYPFEYSVKIVAYIMFFLKYLTRSLVT